LDAYNLYQKAADNMKEIDDIEELRTINNIKIRYNAANDEAEGLALNGDVDAQLFMGCLYQYGFEIKRNKEKAVYWYELANTNGSVEASEQLIIIDNEMI
jgi:TPR repeat protein